ncbi:hypothetical protein I4U23_016721 [Adineta vaga]|nr:hypothetical protein I4U23_016721 [Adineta vaga]
MGNKNSPSNSSKDSQQRDLSNAGKQDHTIIADKTAAAIATSNDSSQSEERKLPNKPKVDRPPIDRMGGSCRMFFPTSGHMGFELIKTSDEYPPIEILRDMIAYETRIRLSEPLQELMDEYYQDEDAVTFVHDLIQQHVVEFFGYHDVNALRTAVYRFPDDPAIKSAFYVKHNKITQGLINQYDSIRDVELCTLDAHARDQWPIENAQDCKKNCQFEMPMLVDTMNNTFHLTYGSWPFRFYIIHGGKLVLKAEPHKENFRYDIDQLDQWIANFNLNA